MYRFVHRQDFVTTVPPPISLSPLDPGDRFTHVGDLVPLDDSGKIPPTGRQPEIWDVVADTVFNSPEAWARNALNLRLEKLGQGLNPVIRAGALTDHAPKFYADLLKQAAGIS